MSKDKILKNLVRQLITHGKIKTTESRAKKLREIAGGRNEFVKIVKLGRRAGDNAQMALVELIKKDQLSVVGNQTSGNLESGKQKSEIRKLKTGKGKKIIKK